EATDRLPATLCMIGGKWTTFRSFGALAADMALERLGSKRKVGTEDLAIGGGRAFPANPAQWIAGLAQRHGLSPGYAERLFERYGTSAEAITADIAKFPIEVLPGSNYSAGEIAGIVEREQVETLADLFLRRTTIAITGSLTPDLIDAALAILAAQKGWDAERSARERAAFLALLASQHGVRFPDCAHTNDKRSALCA